MLANDQLSTAIELIACFTYHASAQAGVAQLVEQRIRNAKVGGSTPLSGTTISPIYLYSNNLLVYVIAHSLVFGFKSLDLGSDSPAAHRYRTVPAASAELGLNRQRLIGGGV